MIARLPPAALPSWPMDEREATGLRWRRVVAVTLAVLAPTLAALSILVSTYRAGA